MQTLLACGRIPDNVGEELSDWAIILCTSRARAQSESFRSSLSVGYKARKGSKKHMLPRSASLQLRIKRDIGN